MTVVSLILGIHDTLLQYITDLYSRQKTKYAIISIFDLFNSIKVYSILLFLYRLEGWRKCLRIDGKQWPHPLTDLQTHSDPLMRIPVVF